MAAFNQRMHTSQSSQRSFDQVMLSSNNSDSPATHLMQSPRRDEVEEQKKPIFDPREVKPTEKICIEMLGRAHLGVVLLPSTEDTFE